MPVCNRCGNLESILYSVKTSKNTREDLCVSCIDAQTVAKPENNPDFEEPEEVL